MPQLLNKQKVYLNRGQRLVRTYSPNSKTIVASRRFGKSDGILGPDFLRDVQYMPQGAGALYQASFKQLLSRTLPGTLAFLERLGIKQDIHYFVGRKAPTWMSFKQPFVKPLNWEHSIHFYNGTVVNLLSQDVRFSANSLTLDWLKCDEARSLKKEKLFEEVIPAISGSPGKFKNIPWHKGKTFVSDKPTSKQGMWVIDEEKKMNTPENTQLKELITALLFKRKQIYHRYGNQLKDFPKALNNIKKINQDLQFFRRYLYMYFEFDTIENIEIVGIEYIKEMKRTLPPITFQISIMNKLMRKDPSGFYANLNPAIHYYQSSNINYLNNQRTNKDTLDLTKLERQSSLFDNDIDKEQPLYIACDYNANINWVVTAQPQKNRMMTLSSFFTKHEQKLRSLLHYWAEYYSELPKKEVVFYYNRTALDSSYADEQTENFAQIVQKELTAKGWYVHMYFVGNPMKHNLKHQYINDALTGAKYLFPMFNQANNEFLLPAMELAGIRIGTNGFRKDKSGEKLADSDEDPLELRTDGTDAWDDLFIGLNFFPFTNSYTGQATTVLE